MSIPPDSGPWVTGPWDTYEKMVVKDAVSKHPKSFPYGMAIRISCTLRRTPEAVTMQAYRIRMERKQ